MRRLNFLGTCSYLQFSPHRQAVSIVSAGHPPPLIIAPDGHPQQADVEPDLLLGVDSGATYHETTLLLPRGATLVLYTDGLIESRSMSLDAGIARLLQTPRQVGRGDLETLADHLIGQAPPGQREDDLTLLLLRQKDDDQPT